MPSNPTTKSQVQAYRFMLRRMESALVRKDAVMLHEPMRHHLRASAVGLVLGVLGLAAFFVVGLFKQAGSVEAGQIVAIEGTTQVFVVVQGQGDGELRKVPVTSLTYARLLFAALNPGVSEAPETEHVEASALAGIAEAGRVGLDGAPTDLPDQENLVGGDWSVCDTADLQEGRSNAESRPPLSTTVIGGVPEPGDPLGQDRALLVEEASSQTRYLVWNGRRWEIDRDNSAVRLGYQLEGIEPRKVSAGLLNAIPEGNSLNPPDIPGAGQPSNFPQLRGVQVGEVIRLVSAGQESFFLVRKEGREQVQPAVANLMSLVNNRTATFKEIPARDITAVPEFNTRDFDNFPAQVPDVLTTTETPIACLVWQGIDQAPVITFSTDDTGLLGEGKRPVPVPNAVFGIQADRVFLEPGKAALVRGVVPDQDPDLGGGIWLVIDQQRYGVLNIDVARALRLGERTTPAPDSILKLLRQGPTLDPQDALERYDPELAQQRQAGR